MQQVIVNTLYWNYSHTWQSYSPVEISCHLNVNFQCSKDPVCSAARMLAVNVFANHWYIHICTCHRLRAILTFLHNESYQVHITCLWPDIHIWIWRRWWWNLAAMLPSLWTFCSCITFASWTPHNGRLLCNLQPCLRDQNRYFKPKDYISQHLSSVYCVWT